MSFPRYPAYKDSEADWLGAVPVHWNVTRVANLFLQVDEPGNEDLPILSVSIHTGVSDKEMSEQEMERKVTRSDDRSTYKRVAPGDLTYNMMRAWQGAFGAVATDGMVSPAYVVARPKGKFITQFVEHQLRSPNAIEEMRRYSRGVTDFRLRLYWEDFKAVQLALPPLDDQIQIVQILERETTKIDALVAEQEQLITLLKEKRQAVISHAVTKGLVPSVPMKDSGVEWLGEVPAHWAVGKCGFYIRILSGFAFPSSGFSHDEANHRLLRGANVGVSRLKWDDTVYWERSDDDGLDEYEMSEGDLVIGMDRPLISEGIRVAKVTAEDLPSLLLQRVASLKVEPKLHVDYLHHLLSSEMFIAHFSPETTGVSVPHISPDQINNFVIPVPPIDEQRAIVEHLSNLATSYSGLIDEAVLSIELLRERRSALISAAVTGQIDVRGLTADKEAA